MQERLSSLVSEETKPWTQVFVELQDKIARALSYSNYAYDLEGLWNAIASGRFQVIYTNNAIVLMETIDYPRFRLLNFFLAAGDLEDCEFLEPIGCEWGRSRGCTRAAMLGRKGWGRSFLDRLGWRVEPVIALTKDLRHG